MRQAYSLTTLTLTFAYSVATASGLDISPGPLPGEITLKDSGESKTYENIIGDKDGIYRAITYINESPVLFSGSLHEAYHTLRIKNSEIFVDCIYFSLRSSITGLRLARGVCGLNERLTANYAEETYKYTNAWLKEAAKVDISGLTNKKKPLIFYEKTKSSFDLYEIYEDTSDLENARPASVIKLKDSCYALNGATPYLIYHKGDLDQAIEIQALEDGEPMSMSLVDKNYLDNLGKTMCPEEGGDEF